MTRVPLSDEYRTHDSVACFDLNEVVERIERSEDLPAKRAVRAGSRRWGARTTPGTAAYKPGPPRLLHREFGC